LGSFDSHTRFRDSMRLAVPGSRLLRRFTAAHAIYQISQGFWIRAKAAPSSRRSRSFTPLPSSPSEAAGSTFKSDRPEIDRLERSFVQAVVNIFVTLG
jgi:hypothetical protein